MESSWTWDWTRPLQCKADSQPLDHQGSPTRANSEGESFSSLVRSHWVKLRMEKWFTMKSRAPRRLLRRVPIVMPPLGPGSMNAHLFGCTGSKVRGRKARARFSVTWILLAVKVFLCSWMNGKSMRLKHLVVLLAPLWKQAAHFQEWTKVRREGEEPYVGTLCTFWSIVL